MKILIFIISFLAIHSCASKMSYQELAVQLIKSSANSNPTGKYKSDFLKVYKPYSDYLFSPSQRDDSLYNDHVSVIYLNDGMNFTFSSTFLNDTCTSIGMYFHEPIDSNNFTLIKNYIENRCGTAIESHKDETGGHLSFKADINVFSWNIKGIKAQIEYNLDSKSLFFEMDIDSLKKRVEKILLTNVMYEKPDLISKPSVIIPDSMKNKYPNYKGKFTYKVEFDTLGNIQNYELFYGDSLLEPFISPSLKDYKFKPALNRFGDPIISKWMIPIKVDLTQDSMKIKQ